MKIFFKKNQKLYTILISYDFIIIYHEFVFCVFWAIITTRIWWGDR